MGRRDEHSAELARRALEGIAAKIALAGVHEFAIALAEVCGPALPLDEAMQVFLEALSRAYPEDDLSDPPYRPALEAQARNEDRLAGARKRRAALAAARQEMLARHAEERANAGEEPVESDEHEAPERPVAGALPEEDEPAPPPLPDPASVPEPELEPQPERTVHVVLLGSSEELRGLRAGLADLGSAEDSALDVDWAR